jgi:hypothetical protein
MQNAPNIGQRKSGAHLRVDLRIILLLPTFFFFMHLSTPGTLIIYKAQRQPPAAVAVV